MFVAKVFSFRLLSLTAECPVLQNLRERKALQSQKEYNAF